MVATSTVVVLDVLIPANSPQAALRVYETLTGLDSPPPGAWRDCARRLRRAAAEAHPAFAAKYISRAVDCDARATRMEVRS